MWRDPGSVLYPPVTVDSRCRVRRVATPGSPGSRGGPPLATVLNGTTRITYSPVRPDDELSELQGSGCGRRPVLPGVRGGSRGAHRQPGWGPEGGRHAGGTAGPGSTSDGVGAGRCRAHPARSRRPSGPAEPAARRRGPAGTDPADTATARAARRRPERRGVARGLPAGAAGRRCRRARGRRRGRVVPLPPGGRSPRGCPAKLGGLDRRRFRGLRAGGPLGLAAAGQLATGPRGELRPPGGCGADDGIPGATRQAETDATVREVYVWDPPDGSPRRVTDRLTLRTEEGIWKLWDVRNTGDQPVEG